MFVTNRTVETRKDIVNDICTLREFTAYSLQQIRVDITPVDTTCTSLLFILPTVKQKVVYILHGDRKELLLLHCLCDLLNPAVKER